ncbi:prepilin-type N-terminal cleavage/methylation domain-containing protein [Psychromonas sp. MME2]|uniref:PilW family protein n=1 Tax=unclassified Psychromonas TaxID=2614957 RepID=UPI00339C6522
MYIKRFPKSKLKTKQVGFTLIELMVAMTISLSLVFACTTLYGSLKNSINIAQNLSNAQESLRGAFYLLSRSVHQAQGININGVNTANQELVVTYGEPQSGGILYGCLGNSMVSGSSDTYYSDGAGLYCDDGSGAQLITLDVERLRFDNITGTNEEGLIVKLKVTGMPDSLGNDGVTFKLALRQKILTNLLE